MTHFWSDRFSLRINPFSFFPVGSTECMERHGLLYFITSTVIALQKTETYYVYRYTYTSTSTDFTGLLVDVWKICSLSRKGVLFNFLRNSISTVEFNRNKRTFNHWESCTSKFHFSTLTLMLNFNKPSLYFYSLIFFFF